MPKLKYLLPRSSSKLVCDHIYNILSLNKLQRLIVKRILYYIIKNKYKMQVTIENYLLLYIKDKDNINKTWVI